MKIRIFPFISLLSVSLALLQNSGAATRVIDFEDLGLAEGTFLDGSDGKSGFYSGDSFFENDFVDWGYGFTSWSGFAVSRVNDPLTAGFENQYAVWGSGRDVSGSGAYAVGYVDEEFGIVPSITLPAPSMVSGLYINNTAYAALSMRDGDSFSRAFQVGEEDWMILMVEGFDCDDNYLGGISVTMADYRKSAFLPDDWRWVDLSSLGRSVKRLEFRAECSDPGKPPYFAVDNIEFIPQPTTVVLNFDRLPYIPEGQDFWSGPDDDAGFRDSAVHFENTVSYGFNFGFYLSRVEDTHTPGYQNQYAVWGDGRDVSGDGQYLVSGAGGGEDEVGLITFPYDVRAEGLYVNNTTYAALSMLSGDSFAKKFGGPTGDDKDWFLLTVTAKDAGGQALGTTNIYLADYRFEDNTRDYILDEWTWLDLSGFRSGVRSLEFALSSSDTYYGYLNTPAYFAIDNLTYSYAPSAALDEGGSLLDQGIAAFTVEDGVEVFNPIFKAWASAVIEYEPAPGVFPQYANPENALGPATASVFDTVSLGDLDDEQLALGLEPGYITLGFESPIRDGAGPDFAVFENGFISDFGGGVFAELAYVEVSSDGAHFARFPGMSLTPEPVGAIFMGNEKGSLKPRDIYNLAGKHCNSSEGDAYGTPFDLADLADHPLVVEGYVDLGNITQVRIVDIPGSGDFRDSYGNPIYDAWPTIMSGGFDLEAIGVINTALEGATDCGVTLNWLVGNRLINAPGENEAEAVLAALSAPGSILDRDTDNDGQSARAEFFAGTDPNNAASRLRILAVSYADGRALVEWEGGNSGSNRDFALQWSGDPGVGEWLEAASVPRVAGRRQFWEGVAPSDDAAFFRVIIGNDTD